jgi:hypothetical protein
MNTGYGRYGATYNMVAFSCFNDKFPCVWVELLLLPKNPTEAKLQAMSTWGESTEPTKGVMKHTYKVAITQWLLAINLLFPWLEFLMSLGSRLQNQYDAPVRTGWGI